MAEFEKPTCKRFVALFDIMGFKDRVYRDSHDDILKMMEKLQQEVENIKSVGELAITYQPKPSDDVSDDLFKLFRENAPSLKVLPVFFSDQYYLFLEMIQRTAR